MDEQRMAVTGRRVQYATSRLGMMLSADRAYRAAVAQHGDAASRGDQGALERLHDAGRVAGSVSGGMLGRMA